MEYIKKYKIYIIVIVIILIIGMLIFNKKEERSEENLVLENKEVKQTDKIKVDIKGEINKPGVYELSSETRVSDAIEVGGGLTEKADTSMLNLSKNLTDEMVIIIYSKDEINEMRKGNTSVKVVERECICPKIENNACIENKVTNYDNNQSNNQNNNQGSQNNNQGNQTNGKVSLNNASIKELMTLTGIGESKAKAIIEYREKNNGFKTIEEIKKVSGIGDATYAKIKDRITL